MKYKDLLEKVTFMILPVVNPDGYTFSNKKVHSRIRQTDCDINHIAFFFQENRFWRKSRQNVSEHCVGVDLNRNFDVFWTGYIFFS